jgi:hypothetical protein
MIAMVLLFQLNTEVLWRQAEEGQKASQEYTAHEMDTSGRARLRTESLVVMNLIDELDEKQAELDSCRTMQMRVQKEP